MSLTPDLVLLFTALAVLLADAAFAQTWPRLPRQMAIAGTGVTLLLLALSSGNAVGLSTYDVSPMGHWWRMVFTGLLLAVQILSKGKWATAGAENGNAIESENASDSPETSKLPSPGNEDSRDGALHALLLFSTLGMYVLVGSKEWLSFFLGLELATLPLIALVAFRARQVYGVEAGMKLVVMTALSMALNVFGLSLIYGATGDLTFAAAQAFAGHGDPLFLLGAFLVLSALLFKIAAVPLHLWAPDVYEGSPFAVTAFLAVASKAAGLAALAKLFFGPLDALRVSFAGFFLLAALASQFVGNLGAMRQDRFTRFIAYSSIAQAGFFLLAFLGEKRSSEEALLFNVLSYGVSTLTLFYLWRLVSPTANASMTTLQGLAKRSPASAFGMALALISLAGIPPLVGFLGKYLVFQSIAMEGHYVVLVFALANAVISLYYYARWVLVAYTLPDEENTRGDSPAIPVRHSWGAWVAAATLVLLGVTPFLLDASARHSQVRNWSLGL